MISFINDIIGDRVRFSIEAHGLTEFVGIFTKEEQIEAHEQALEQLKGGNTCTWTQGDWDDSDCFSTSCDEEFTLIDGTPTENRIKYCHHCGKPVVEQLKGRE